MPVPGRLAKSQRSVVEKFIIRKILIVVVLLIAVWFIIRNVRILIGIAHVSGREIFRRLIGQKVVHFKIRAVEFVFPLVVVVRAFVIRRHRFDVAHFPSLLSDYSPLSVRINKLFY